MSKVWRGVVVAAVVAALATSGVGVANAGTSGDPTNVKLSQTTAKAGEVIRASQKFSCGAAAMPGWGSKVRVGLASSATDWWNAGALKSVVEKNLSGNEAWSIDYRMPATITSGDHFLAWTCGYIYPQLGAQAATDISSWEVDEATRSIKFYYSASGVRKSGTIPEASIQWEFVSSNGGQFGYPLWKLKAPALGNPNLQIYATEGYSYHEGTKLTVVGDTTPEPSPAFVDVPKGHKFYNAIAWMRMKKLSTGTKSAAGLMYEPKTSLTREAMAAFIYRLESPNGFTAPTVSPFADVQPGDRFYREIAWMHSAGLANGTRQPTGKPRFEPKAGLSREAMAAFIYRLEKPQGYRAPAVSGFVDMQPGVKFYREVSWMKDTKLANGSAAGAGRAYLPKDTLTREAMAAFLYRLVESYRPGK